MGIYLEETRIEKDPCTSVFNAALFTIAVTWKELRCPSANEWIKKLWYTHTMEYYSAIERNAFNSVLMRWMNLVLIIQSEFRKIKIIPYTNTYRMESRKMVLIILHAGRQRSCCCSCC